jgi:hypothetical protein
MGAKTWMLVYAEGNASERLAAGSSLDRGASSKVASELFPEDLLEPIADTSLSFTCPPDDEVHIGAFSGVTVIAAKEFGLDKPSTLPVRFLTNAAGRVVYLHAMHSVVDWLAFAVWRHGKLQRSLSLAPDDGVIEDIGSRLAFELPYWSGEHPAIDPANQAEDEPSYPFPFHPLELGEAALREFFGYQLEGYVDPSLLEPRSVPLMRFKRRKSRLKL